jgi:hypothetical protein
MTEKEPKDTRKDPRFPAWHQRNTIDVKPEKPTKTEKPDK